MKKTVLYIGILLLIFSSSAWAQTDQETTIILIRHAEKVDNSRDPELNDKGKERALALLDLLQNTQIDAIYSTNYIRTKDTVQPLADHTSLDIDLYDPRSQDFIRKIYRDHIGETVVVSGHSNTTPAALNVITGSKKYPNMDHDEYSSLFIASISKWGSARIIKLKYGE